MKTMVKLEIDKQAVVVEKGLTILQAARQAGIYIPTLCHDDRLKPAGDCRLCLVEVARGNRRKLAVSCIHSTECASCMQCYSLCTGGWLVRERGQAPEESWEVSVAG